MQARFTMFMIVGWGADRADWIHITVHGPQRNEPSQDPHNRLRPLKIFGYFGQHPENRNTQQNSASKRYQTLGKSSQRCYQDAREDAYYCNNGNAGDGGREHCSSILERSYDARTHHAKRVLLSYYQ